jgi:hypothetical protein
MTTSEGTGAQTITEHELAQCQRANQTGRQPVGVRPWPVAAAQQLGPVGGAVSS